MADKSKKTGETVSPMYVSLPQMTPLQRYYAKRILGGYLDFYFMKEKYPDIFADGKIEEWLRQNGYDFGEGENNGNGNM